MAFRMASKPPTGLLGTLLPDGTSQERRWRNILSVKDVTWLRDHQLEGVPVFPAAGYVAMALEALQVICGDDSMRLQTAEVRDLDITRPITFGDDTTGVEILFSVTNITRGLYESEVLSASFKCFSRASKGSETMAITASSTLHPSLNGPSPKALPPRSPDPLDLVDVSPERFYTSLQALGYGYSGYFKGFQSIKRKLGAATGVVINPDPWAKYLVHPAMLDSAFQSIFSHTVGQMMAISSPCISLRILSGSRSTWTWRVMSCNDLASCLLGAEFPRLATIQSVAISRSTKHREPQISSFKWKG